MAACKPAMPSRTLEERCLRRSCHTLGIGSCCGHRCNAFSWWFRHHVAATSRKLSASSTFANTKATAAGGFSGNKSSVMTVRQGSRECFMHNGRMSSQRVFEIDTPPPMVEALPPPRRCFTGTCREQHDVFWHPKPRTLPCLMATTAQQGIQAGPLAFHSRLIC
jgi:hypothetical protein